jgi:host factor-I protein
MDKLPQNIQETFLNAARKDRTFLTIYLMSGVKLSGRIRSFDKYSVVLESNAQEQLIFKHAISTVVVARPIPAGAPGHTGHALPGAVGAPQPLGVPHTGTNHTAHVAGPSGHAMPGIAAHNLVPEPVET